MLEKTMPTGDSWVCTITPCTSHGLVPCIQNYVYIISFSLLAAPSTFFFLKCFIAFQTPFNYRTKKLHWAFQSVEERPSKGPVNELNGNRRNTEKGDSSGISSYSCLHKNWLILSPFSVGKAKGWGEALQADKNLRTVTIFLPAPF